jgi:hypothetical protein
MVGFMLLTEVTKGLLVPIIVEIIPFVGTVRKRENILNEI